MGNEDSSSDSSPEHSGVQHLADDKLLELVDLNLHRIDKVRRLLNMAAISWVANHRVPSWYSDIFQDVHRCDRSYWYFTENNLKKLRNIMCTYVWRNLDIGYIQGMCDLVAPLLVIFDDGWFDYYQWQVYVYTYL